eukprot:CAMPEP_0196186004 /NCGR_PEP_ID=MMETSP0911-20130528/37386_1 /TAXON_ID=49265 /ORGANISM="Thalassiosira rotula, Strain GSO102" /LENGTH=107 /DNA_ID=CAMNT_0041456675 /DNA_START=142 /DNA_END=465 /DNA_ORIENTATION=-
MPRSPPALCFATYVNTESAGWLTTLDNAPEIPPAMRLTPSAVKVASLNSGLTAKMASEARSNARNFTLPKMTCRVMSDGSPAYTFFHPNSSFSVPITFKVPNKPNSL